MRRSDYGRFLWGAIVELIFGAVLFVALTMFIAEPIRVAFLRETATDLLAVTGQVLFPSAVAVWITYVNIESTSFGDYLRFQGAARAFHLGFIYPSLTFFATTVALIVIKGTKFLVMTDLVIFLLAYCVVVFFVMVLNVATVMRLYGAFRVELEREQRCDEGQNVANGSAKSGR